MVLWYYNTIMQTKTRRRTPGPKAGRHATVVRLDPDVRQGTRLRKALTGASLSDQVNEALRERLKADRELLRKRMAEPMMTFDTESSGHKRRGRL